MIPLILGGYILLVGSPDGGITVVPTQYASKRACQDAAYEIADGLPIMIQWRCLKAGTGIGGRP